MPAMNINDFSERIGQVTDSLDRMVRDRQMLSTVITVADLIAEAMGHGNKLLICGNGGSAADAQHMAGEFVCRFCKDRAPLPALALSTDTSVLTAISNDYSYADVFGRQVLAHGRKGDVLFGISTSGNSGNIKCAFEAAKGIGVKTVLLTGEGPSSIEALADIIIKAPSTETPRIQEMHLIIEHVICEAIEGKICG
jgi:D-sedoheptulose 7-phosphate isomerase